MVLFEPLGPIPLTRKGPNAEGGRSLVRRLQSRNGHGSLLIISSLPAAAARSAIRIVVRRDTAMLWAQQVNCGRWRPEIPNIPDKFDGRTGVLPIPADVCRFCPK